MRMIPTVSADLLVCAERKVAADHEAGLTPDPTVSVVSALHGKCDAEEMLAIQYRLTALANLIVDGDGDAWTINIHGESHVLVAEPLLHAAASAPLAEAPTLAEFRFGPEILDVALQDVEVEGSG